MSKLLAGITLGTIAVAGAATGTVLAVQSASFTNSQFITLFDKDIEFGGATSDVTQPHRMYGSNRSNELIVGEEKIGQPVINVFSGRQDPFRSNIPLDNAGSIQNFKFLPSNQPSEIISDVPFLKGNSVLDNKIISINLYAMRKENDDFRDYPREFPIYKSAQNGSSPAKETFFGNYLLKFDSVREKWMIKLNSSWQRDRRSMGSSWPGNEDIYTTSIPTYEDVDLPHPFQKDYYINGLLANPSKTKALMVSDVRSDRVWSTAFVQKGKDLFLSTASNRAPIEGEAVVTYVGQMEVIDPSKTDKVMKAPVSNAFIITKNMKTQGKIVIDNGDPANTNANKLYSAFLAGHPYTYLDFTMGNEERVMLDLRGLNSNFEKMHNEGIVKITQLEFHLIDIENKMGPIDNEILSQSSYFHPGKIILTGSNV